MNRRTTPPGLLILSAVLACAGFGVVALVIGMDANWDLRNYHYYNGWAVLHGRWAKDILVSQLASFYNPAIDIPYAWLAGWMPAKALGFLLGAIHGLNVPLLALIAWHLLEVRDRALRAAIALVVALVGAAGGGGLSEVGTVFYDDVVSIGVLASILTVISRWGNLMEGEWGSAALRVLLAGVPAGIAFGLKQPMAIYVTGMGAAFLVVGAGMERRIWLAFWFGTGAAIGLVLGAGPWMWHLWQSYGNPLFPFFNGIFHSPWGLAESYRDPGFLQHGIWQALTLGFRFPFDFDLVGETEFVDLRVLAWEVVVLISILGALRPRPRYRFAPRTESGHGAIRWLVVATLVAYACWVALFSVYRYLIPLEMLAPVLVVALIGIWPLPGEVRAGLAVLLVVILAVTTRAGDWLRVPWAEKAVAVDMPAMDQPENALVLLAGHEPLSYLIPSFPPGPRFVRIDSTFTLPEGDTGFRRLFRETIQGHEGPVYALFVGTEAHDVPAKLAEYGLALAEGDCPEINSPIGPGPYRLCPVTRESGGSPE